MTWDEPRARARVVVDRVQPAVDDGRFPCKEVLGETVVIQAVAFADGHDRIAVDLVWEGPGGKLLRQPMASRGQDVHQAEITAEPLGIHSFRVEAWVDGYETWRAGTLAKAEAGVDIAVELEEGRQRTQRAHDHATEDDDRAVLAQALRRLSSPLTANDLGLVLDASVGRAMRRWGDRAAVTRTRDYEVWVEPLRARFTAWYEFFPRSASPDPERPGTLRDATERLDYVAKLGFDTVYLPPIHPIGRTHRKGRNNARTCEPEDVGSPWAIGAAEGGHTGLHPDLGSWADFDRLVQRADQLGLHLALDVAFQCSPDHPWVTEHPEWFRHRADGTIQYAENPPKKYEDIYPLDFETSDVEGLWAGLRDVFLFWMERGVRTFRVDNPHTKAFPFWEWVIRELKRRDPEVLLLSEAFARPNVAQRLAKLGFTQSYDYFPWKNGKWEIEQFFQEITAEPIRRFFRASSWTNTPDILTEYLQAGGRAAAFVRAVLASTLSASYGVYGPVFELVVNQPREPGSEEYLDSEKYQVRHWDLDESHSLAPLLTRLNRIRHQELPLQSDAGLRFLASSDEGVVAYEKRSGSQLVVCVVNLDPHHPREAMVDLPAPSDHEPYQVHDLISDERFLWMGSRQHFRLEPHGLPARILKLRTRVRRESDFDYFQ
jgi:starch synthase (maltosyl-transferring)